VATAAPPFKRRQRAVEPESAARRAERSALRLELIKRELIVFETKTQVVSSLDLGQVDGGCVLVVAELERAAGIGIADVRDTGDLESRDALIIRPIPFVPEFLACRVHSPHQPRRLGADALAGVAKSLPSTRSVGERYR